jgi:hypothetical protein
VSWLCDIEAEEYEAEADEYGAVPLALFSTECFALCFVAVFPVP